LLRANDRLWHSLASISLTPASKYGIGKLISFDFFAPVFETHHEDPDEKPRKESFAYRNERAELLQYYGIIKFDFRQFGHEDAKLMKDHANVYCQKICHKIGFYLQKIHGLDLVRMRVDF